MSKARQGNWVVSSLPRTSPGLSGHFYHVPFGGRTRKRPGLQPIASPSPVTLVEALDFLSLSFHACMMKQEEQPHGNMIKGNTSKVIGTG